MKLHPIYLYPHQIFSPPCFRSHEEHSRRHYHTDSISSFFPTTHHESPHKQVHQRKPCINKRLTVSECTRNGGRRWSILAFQFFVVCLRYFRSHISVVWQLHNIFGGKLSCVVITFPHQVNAAEVCVICVCERGLCCVVLMGAMTSLDGV